MIKRTFDETAGYDEIITLRDIPIVLRTSFGSDYGLCPYRIPAKGQGCWNLQIGTCRECVRPQAPDTGTAVKAGAIIPH